MKVQRALISVFNKSGLESFAKGLTDLGVQIISTGGTARLLKDAGIPVTLVEEVTGFPEMLDGRVKTMHPRLMAGILARRDVPEHMETINEHDIQPIDMVVCSLYPFEEVAEPARRDGRGRHREHRHRRARDDPRRGQEPRRRRRGHQPRGLRRACSTSCATTTASSSYDTLRDARHQGLPPHRHYDFVIANWFSEARGRLPAVRDARLREGHGAQVRREPAPAGGVLLRGRAAPAPALDRSKQLHGKQLGFNNLYDLNAARSICDEFTLPCVDHHQAQQPVRLRARREPGRGLRQGVRVRSRQRLRLGHRRQPPVDVPLGRAPRRAVRRGALRARLRGRGAGDPQAEAGHPPAAERRAPPGRTPASSTTSASLGGILVQDKDSDSEERDEMTGRHRAAPRPSRSGATSSSPSAWPSTSRATPS